MIPIVESPSRLRHLSLVSLCLVTSIVLLSLGTPLFKSSTTPYAKDVNVPGSWMSSKHHWGISDHAKETQASSQSNKTIIDDPKALRGADNIDEVFNTTLGFEQIFMISLPERGDRQDTFTVLAEMTNFTWTLMDGVKGQDVVNKSLPMGMTAEKIGLNAVGSWRAHMNVIRHIVYNKIQTSLIFEDDADWDVTIRYQLKQYAQATRWLLNQAERGVPFSPYGDGWDVLTIGHCDSEPWKTDMRRWVIPNDPTVILPHLRGGAWIPDMKPWQAWNSSHPKASNQTRICYTADWLTCTTAYALSLQGATKLLYWMSMMPYPHKFDNGIGWILRQRHERSEILGIGCYPTYIGITHGAGTNAKFSDIEVKTGTQSLPKSERVQFATRQNIDRLLRGNDTLVGAYTMEEIEMAQDKSKRTPYLAKFDDIIRPQGNPEMLIKSKKEDGIELWESIPEADYNKRFGPTPRTELGKRA